MMLSVLNRKSVRKGFCCKVYIGCIVGLILYFSARNILFGSPTILPPKEEFDNKSADELEDIFHGFINSVQFQCHKIVRVGSVGDGGWFVCLDGIYHPTIPCLVYSFGIGDDSSFDVQMKKMFGCEVHSFDPFVNKTVVPNIRSLNFHSIGIIDESRTVDGQHFMSLTDIRKYLNHSMRSLTILKMDVEMAEWHSLRKAMSDRQLDSVKQLLVEFHLLSYLEDTKSDIYKMALIIMKDLTKMGFQIFLTDKNTDCNYKNYKNQLLTKCYNVHMVKLR
ncbi:methyltransferase-like protein 24 [Argonauta hians]